MTKFYLLINEETTGPFSVTELQAMLRRGAIAWDTLYATEGARDWQPVTALKEVLKDDMRVTAPLDSTRIPNWAIGAAIACGVMLLLVTGRPADIDGLVWLVWGLVGLVVYFIPSYVGRQHKNFAAICVLNIFLGWTFVGWVIALVWALKKD